MAVVEHVASTTRVSSMARVNKRSRANWSKEDWQILQAHGYNIDEAKIVTLEIKGPVFFGSSGKLLQEITQEVGVSMSASDVEQVAFATPHASTPHSRLKAKRVQASSDGKKTKEHSAKRRSFPQFVVLDFSLMHSIDASAATSCFLQLAKLCAKRGILLCGR